MAPAPAAARRRLASSPLAALCALSAGAALLPAARGQTSPTPTPTPTATPTPTPAATGAAECAATFPNVTDLVGLGGATMAGRDLGATGTLLGWNANCLAPADAASGAVAGASYFQVLPNGRAGVYRLDLGPAATLGGVLAVGTAGVSSDDTVVFLGGGCPASKRSFGCVAGNDDAATGVPQSTVQVLALQRVYYVVVTGVGGANVTSGVAWSYAPPTPSITPSASPTPTPPPPPYGCGSLLVPVVGNGASASQLNTAQRVFIEERSVGGELLRRTALRSARGPGGEPACTLGVTSPGADMTYFFDFQNNGYGDTWAYFMDGTPSLSADGRRATLLCYDIPAGQPMAASANKTIASIDATGGVAYSASLNGTYSVLYAASGARQVVSPDGLGPFWTVGGSVNYRGFRYVASLASTNSTLVLGGYASTPGAADARAIALFGGQLYGATTARDGAAQAGVFRIDGTSTPPTALDGTTWSMLSGVHTPWTFVFENATSLWVSVDTRASGVLDSLFQFVAPGTVYQYIFQGGSSWPLYRGVTVSTTMSVHALTGRSEGGQWVMYGTTHAVVYRILPDPVVRTRAAVVTIYRTADSYADTSWTAVRGVAPAPRADPSAACAVSPMPTATSSVTPSATVSGTGTSSGTATTTATASATGACAAAIANITDLAGLSGTTMAGRDLGATGTLLGWSGACARPPGATAVAGASYFTALTAGRVGVYRLDLGAGTPLGGVLAVGTVGVSAANTTVFLGGGCPSSLLAFDCFAGNDDAAPGVGQSTVQLVALRAVYYVVVAGAGGASVMAGVTWAYAPPTVTSTATASATATRSQTPTPPGTPSTSPTPSITPSASPTPMPYDCASVLVLVVGTGSDALDVINTAQPVFIEERSVGGALLRRTPLRSAQANGQPACTLAVSGTDDLTSFWGFEYQDAWGFTPDGTPSLSADGKRAVFWCFDATADETMSLNAGKVIVSVGADGSVIYGASLANTFTDASESYWSSITTFGLRQVASVDGLTGFWLSGSSNDNWGFRYVASLASTSSVYVLGQQASTPGYYDARGITVYGGSLYAGTTVYDVGAGTFRVGTGGLPTAPVTSWAMLSGVLAPWVFVFENATSLWVSPDLEGSGYSGQPTKGMVVQYRAPAAAGGNWTMTRLFNVDATYPLYSISGRYEAPGGGATVWVTYGATPYTLYRVIPAASGAANGTVSVVYRLADDYSSLRRISLRGVVPAPRADPAAACTVPMPPTPTPTPTPSPSATPVGFVPPWLSYLRGSVLTNSSGGSTYTWTGFTAGATAATKDGYSIGAYAGLTSASYMTDWLSCPVSGLRYNNLTYVGGATLSCGVARTSVYQLVCHPTGGTSLTYVTESPSCRYVFRLAVNCTASPFASDAVPWCVDADPTPTATRTATRSPAVSPTTTPSLSGTQTPNNAACPPGWASPGTTSQYCYRAYSGSDWTWGGGIAFCQAAAGGYADSGLASIRNDAEAAYVVTNTCGGMAAGFWVGLNDIAVESGGSSAVGWEWASGASSTYIRSSTGQALWTTNEPSGTATNTPESDCAWLQTFASPRRLDDVYCYNNYSAVCCEARRLDLRPTDSVAPSFSATPLPATPSITPSWTPTVAAPRCPSGWFSPGATSSYCYRPSTNTPPLTWSDAVQFCQAAAGGYSDSGLASVRNAAEGSAVITQGCGSGLVNYWLGLNDIASEAGSSRVSNWVWSSGASTSYIVSSAGRALWGSTEPNNGGGGGGGNEDCVQAGGGTMNDYPCNNPLTQVCCEVRAMDARPSGSRTATPSQSATASATGSSTPTGSTTGTVSGTRTSTAPATATSTSTSASTGLSTSTASASASGTVSTTSTVSQSGTQAATPSQTPTASSTQLATVSPPPSGTPTGSGTATSSGTFTPSMSATSDTPTQPPAAFSPSQSPPPAGPPSGSATGSGTASSTATTPPSPSPSPTRSSAPTVSPPAGPPRQRCSLDALTQRYGAADVGEASSLAALGAAPPVVVDCTGAAVYSSALGAPAVGVGVACRLACALLDATSTVAVADGPASVSVPVASLQWGPPAFFCAPDDSMLPAPPVGVWRPLPARDYAAQQAAWLASGATTDAAVADPPPAAPLNASACLPLRASFPSAAAPPSLAVCGDLARLAWQQPRVEVSSTALLAAVGALPQPLADAAAAGNASVTAAVLAAAVLAAAVQPWAVSGGAYASDATQQADAVRQVLSGALAGFRVDAALSLPASASLTGAGCAVDTTSFPSTVSSVLAVAPALASAPGSVGEVVFNLPQLLVALTNATALQATGAAAARRLSLPSPSGGGRCTFAAALLWLRITPLPFGTPTTAPVSAPWTALLPPLLSAALVPANASDGDSSGLPFVVLSGANATAYTGGTPAASSSSSSIAWFSAQRCAVVDVTVASPLGAAAPLLDAADGLPVFVVTDALPALSLTPVVPVPPADGETLTMRCASSAPSLVTLLPAQLVLSASPPSAAAAGAPTIALTPRFQGSNARAGELTPLSVTCVVTSTVARAGVFPSYAPLVNRTLPLAFLHARWPFVGNAGVLYAQGPRLALAWPEVPQGVYDAIAPHARGPARRPSATPSPRPPPPPPPQPTPPHYRRSLRRLQQAGSIAPPNASSPAGDGAIGDGSGGGGSSGSGSFEIVTSGTADVVLLADCLFWTTPCGPAFTADSRVLVGDAPAAVTAVADDGSWIAVATPPYTAVCGNASDCDPQPLIVVNPLWAGAGAGTAAAAAALSVAVACPPFCPDAATGAHRPPQPVVAALPGSAVTGAGSSIPPVLMLPSPASADAEAPTSGAVASPTGALAAGSVAGIGIRYVEVCVGYTDPLSGACTNVSDPASRLCAWGARDDCRLCPEGAVCPGGYRAWPLPGYYVVSERDGVVAQCIPPATERCVGWDVSARVTLCGPAYRPGSVGCQACADGKFAALDGKCELCPSTASPWSTLLLVVFVLVLCLSVLAAAVTALATWLTSRLGGGNVRATLGRAAELMVWLFTVVQVQVVVSRAASPGLPEYIRQFYSRLAILSFESFGVHPACLGRLGPFLVYQALYAIVLVLLVLEVLLHVNFRRLCGCYLCGLGRKRSSRVLTPHLADVAAAGDDVRPSDVRIKAAIDAAGSLAAVEAAVEAASEAAGAEEKGGSHGSTRSTIGSARAPRGSLIRAGSAFGYASPLGAAARRSVRSGDGVAAGAHSPGAFPLGPAAFGASTPSQAAAEAALSALPPAQRFGARFEAWKPTLRRALFMALTLLYPATTAPVLSNLTCVPQRVSVAVYRTMESDGASLVPYGIPYTPRTVPLTSISAYLRGDPDAATVITVRVLARDPYVVCREGRHAGVYAFSLFILLVYVIGYPLGTLLWVWRRVWQLAGSEPGRHSVESDGAPTKDDSSPMTAAQPPLAAAAEADRHRQWAYVMDAGNWLVRAYRAVAVLLCCAGTRHVRWSLPPGEASLRRLRAQEQRDGVVMVDSPMVQAGAAHGGSGKEGGSAEAQPSAAAVVTAADVIDGCAALTSSGGLGHFTGSEYRPATFWFRQLDLVVLLALTAAVELLPVPTSVNSAVAKALTVWAVLAVAASYFVAQRPFPPGAGWKLFAKVYHLLLLMAITALNLTTWLIHVGRPAASAAVRAATAGFGSSVSVPDVCDATWLAANEAPPPAPGAGGASVPGDATKNATAAVDLAAASTASTAFSAGQLDTLCAARNGLSVVTFALSLLFFLILIVGFVLSMYDGIDKQAKAERRAAAARAAAAAAAAEKAAADKVAAEHAAARPAQLSAYRADVPSRGGVGSGGAMPGHRHRAGGGVGAGASAASVDGAGVVDAPQPHLHIAVPAAASSSAADGTASAGATPSATPATQPQGQLQLRALQPQPEDEDLSTAAATAAAASAAGGTPATAAAAAKRRGVLAQAAAGLSSTRHLFGPARPHATPRHTSTPTPVGDAGMPSLRLGGNGKALPAAADGTAAAGASSAVTGADDGLVFDGVNALFLQQHRASKRDGAGGGGAASRRQDD